VNTVHRLWVLGFPERPTDWPAGLPFNPCSPHSLPPGPVVVHPSEVAHFIELAPESRLPYGIRNAASSRALLAPGRFRAPGGRSILRRRRKG
jgi:hypothetical protein